MPIPKKRLNFTPVSQAMVYLRNLGKKYSQYKKYFKQRLQSSFLRKICPSLSVKCPVALLVLGISLLLLIFLSSKLASTEYTEKREQTFKLVKRHTFGEVLGCHRNSVSMPLSQQESVNESVNFLRSSDPLRAQDNPGSEKSPWLKRRISKSLRENKSDNPGALFKLGVRYDTGDGVNESKKHAVRKYKKAAEQGHPQAQYNLGVSYFNGEGVTQNKRKAFEEFKKAAEQGNAFSQYAVGYCYDDGIDPDKGRDLKEALKWYKMAADQGMILARVELALCYYYGEGFDRNEKKAAGLLEMAVQQGLDEISKGIVAQQGLGKAQLCLGLCYYHGVGVKRDKNKAVALFEMSSQQNDPSGLFSLGFCYENGEGIPQNIDEAIELYTRSAAKGHQKAIERLQALKILKK